MPLPALGRQSQADLYESSPAWSTRDSSRTVRVVTQRNLVSKDKNKKTQTKQNNNNKKNQQKKRVLNTYGQTPKITGKNVMNTVATENRNSR